MYILYIYIYIYIYIYNLNFVYNLNFGLSFPVSFSMLFPEARVSCVFAALYFHLMSSKSTSWAQKVCIRFLKSYFKIEILIFLPFDIFGYALYWGKQYYQ